MNSWTASTIAALEDHDKAPPTRPTKVVVIASLPRTGSTLLGGALRDTRSVGTPFEYLNPMVMEAFHRRLGLPRPTPRGTLGRLRQRVRGRPAHKLRTRWSPSSVRRYLRWVMHNRTTENGLASLKVHWPHLAEARRRWHVDLDTLEVPRQVISLRREDRRGQALSWLRARDTDVWSVPAGSEPAVSRPPSSPSTDRVDAAVRQLMAWERCWDEYFEQNEIDPVTVRYEDLAEDYEATVAHCLGRLGLSDVAVPPPSVQKQAGPP